jgi:hypothetical protein
MNISISQIWRNNFVSELLPKDDQIVSAVKTLALADPDYLAFVEQYRELSFARTSPALEDELGRDLIALLQQMPDRAEQLARLNRSNERSAFDGGVATVPVLLAAVFLLRTHLRIKRSSGGKWEFLVEHKPGDSQLVSQLLAKIADLLSRH